MFVGLILYIFVVVVVIAICLLYSRKRSKQIQSPKKKKVDKFIQFSNDNYFLGNSFSILLKQQISPCRNTTKGNYPCANLQKMDSISNPPLIFKTHNKIYNHSRNWYVLTDKIIHFPNSTQKFNLINTTAFAYGFKDVIITRDGTIHSKCWNIGPKGCCLCHIVNGHVKYPDNTLKVYNKVIDIAHPWGIYVFHSIVECLAKLGYYIDELLNDKSIMIHVPGNFVKKYFVFLGFNRSRLITGNIYVKNLLTLERGSCGGSPSLLQVLSLKSYIRKKIIALNNFQYKYDVVLIKRRGVREIINHEELLKTLKDIYGENAVIVFNEDEKVVNVLTFFTYAKLIVAPHGAGLSHILFCDYNAIILEFSSVPRMNGCYVGLASKLGLRYYGLKCNATKSYKFIVNINLVKPLLKEIKSKLYN